MSTDRECPSAEQLQQMALGQLPDPPASSVEQHLLDCEPCTLATLNLVADETLVEAMRKATVGATPLPDGVSRLIQKLRDLPTQQASSVDGATVLSSATGHDTMPTDDWSACFTPAESADEIGRLNGFRVLKLLGQGGMGGVFLAEDMQLRRLVALKMMRPRAAAASGAAERFLREARVAAALRHDHIITIYQVGEEAGVPFLAMEYLEGESLDDRLRRESTLPVADVLRIGREIAEGLAAAHAKGLIHRDIKPANVWLESSRHVPRDEPLATDTRMLLEASDALAEKAHHAERDGDVEGIRLKLLDFGLARSNDAESQITSAGVIIGTPSYMAPEQASGEAVDHRADLFSLGVVLYRMTTGKLPFPGKNMMETLKLLATVTPASASSVNPEVPRELSDLIDRLLSKDRDARPASAQEVARELRQRRSPVVPRLGFAESDSDNTQRLSTTGRNAGNASHGMTRLRWLGLAAAMVLLGVIVVKMQDEGREGNRGHDQRAG